MANDAQPGGESAMDDDGELGLSFDEQPGPLKAAGAPGIPAKAGLPSQSVKPGKAPSRSNSREGVGAARNPPQAPANSDSLPTLANHSTPPSSRPNSQAPPASAGLHTPPVAGSKPQSANGDGRLPSITPVKSASASKGGIPKPSPGAVRKPSPGPGSRFSNIPRADPGELQSQHSNSSAERRRSRSPGGPSEVREGGWNYFGRESPRRKRDISISGPSEEEKRKRAEWARMKRMREEAKAREEAEKRAAEDQKRKDEEQARLAERRRLIRERIARQHEISAKMAEERAKAEEDARSKINRLRSDKPLYEKLQEEYEKQQAALELEKKQKYDEEARNKLVRPRQIISGEVQVKPAHPREPPPDLRNGFGPPRGSVTSLEGSPKAARASPPRRRSPGGHGGADEAPGNVEQAPDMAKDKPRVPGMVLYSTRAKAAPSNNFPAAAFPQRNGPLPHLVERACSPFIFGSDGMPVNVPPPTLVLPPSRNGEARSGSAAQVLQVIAEGAEQAASSFAPEADIPEPASKQGSRPPAAAAAAQPISLSQEDQDVPLLDSPPALSCSGERSGRDEAPPLAGDSSGGGQGLVFAASEPPEEPPEQGGQQEDSGGVTDVAEDEGTPAGVVEAERGEPLLAEGEEGVDTALVDTAAALDADGAGDAVDEVLAPEPSGLEDEPLVGSLPGGADGEEQTTNAAALPDEDPAGDGAEAALKAPETGTTERDGVNVGADGEAVEAGSSEAGVLSAEQADADPLESPAEGGDMQDGDVPGGDAAPAESGSIHAETGKATVQAEAEGAAGEDTGSPQTAGAAGGAQTGADPEGHDHSQT